MEQTNKKLLGVGLAIIAALVAAILCIPMQATAADDSNKITKVNIKNIQPPAPGSAGSPILQFEYDIEPANAQVVITSNWAYGLGYGYHEVLTAKSGETYFANFYIKPAEGYEWGSRVIIGLDDKVAQLSDDVWTISKNGQTYHMMTQELYKVGDAPASGGDDPSSKPDTGDSVNPDVADALAAQISYLKQTAGLVDLNEGEWYMQTGPKKGAFDDGTLYLQYAVEKNLMQGYTDKKTGKITGFGPNDNLTRAQVAAILYRYENQEDPSKDLTKNEELYKDIANDTPLVDVEDGQWYTQAVNWAVSHKIIKGYSDDNTFRPDANVSRQELATMIGRMVFGEKGEGDPSELSMFADAGQVAGWAVPYVSLCQMWGIISGVGDTGKFAPQDKATRAQMAKIIAVTVHDVLEAGKC